MKFLTKIFVEEIIWAYGSPSGVRATTPKPVNIHDYILHYAKNYSQRKQNRIYAKPVPDFVSANLNPNFELRPYQREALENFITHFESSTCPRPTQVLFHMATGSGKTFIMAGLILYLYKRGYRNFLFFVNLTNILDKTRDNFLNAASSKC